MTLNVDELQVSSLSVGQSVQVTADAVPDKTYTGVVTRVSLKGTSNGGTTTYRSRCALMRPMPAPGHERQC